MLLSLFLSDGWWELVNWDYASSEYTRVLNKWSRRV